MSLRSGGGGGLDGASSRLGSLGSLGASLRGAYDLEQQREPGTRRRRLAGYLKAANELRQTYQQNYLGGLNNNDGPADGRDIPGAYAGATAARSGDEEMVIFPSYARRHVKKEPRRAEAAQDTDDASRAAGDSSGPEDAEFWRKEWERYENDNAVVDVDVRGWLYVPHRGPMNRKTRLFVGLARQLVGVPAPAGTSPTGSGPNSRSSSPHGFRQRLDANNKKYEEEIAAQAAESIIKKGEAEASIAGQGGYSEKPGDDSSSVRGVEGGSSNLATPVNEEPSRSSSPSASTEPYDDPRITPVQKRASWNDPSQMSQEELKTANQYLMQRLQPFLANPVPSIPVSAFFYNDTMSRQKTIETNAYGHFTLRAALDFVPTHVRVLVNENLSATEEVHVSEHHGVSVISDVDDTIKHSAIGSGAREIFRNVFIRELGDLTIQGVREWYRSMANLGASFHYVSNSPWQLYPVLTGYFSVAALPPGSFHLKQYNGMLQGIFEPVAERKKGPLQKILHDFPERRFLLIGDSGEADLEVYTDLVLENPGRVLGVFIRDITTPPQKGFFDTSLGPLSGEKSQRARMFNDVRLNRLQKNRAGPAKWDDDDPELKAAIAASLAEYENSKRQNGAAEETESPSDEERPPLPPRRQSAPLVEEEDLIDLNWEDDKPSSTSPAQAKDEVAHDTLEPPPLPPKPRRLSAPNVHEADTPVTKTAPPVPRKPVGMSAGRASSSQPSARPKNANSGDGPSKPTPVPPPAKITYTEAAQSTMNAAYESLPTLRTTDKASHKPTPPAKNLAASQAATSTAQDRSSAKPPPVPPNKPISSYPAAAAQYASTLYSNYMRSAEAGGGGEHARPAPQRAATLPSADARAPNSGAGAGGGGAYGDAGTYYPGASKREELWKRRWARAKTILDERGVVLMAWRVGDDVAAEGLRLIERCVREDRTGGPG